MIDKNTTIVPLYKKVKRYILDKIADGEFTPSSRVPSENELVKILFVSRMTANRALKELETEGILTRVPGVGTFVAEASTRGLLLEVTNIADEVRERGHNYSNFVVKHEVTSLPKAIALQLGQSETIAACHTIIVHYEDDKPIQLEDRYVNLNALPAYRAIDLAATTPSQFLLEKAPLQKVQHTVRASMPSQSIKNHLGMQDNTPCLILERTTWSGGQPVSFALLYHCADYYCLTQTFDL